MKFPPADQLHTEESQEFLKGILTKTGVECPPPLTSVRMIDALVGHYLEEQCVSYYSTAFIGRSRHEANMVE